MIGTLAELDDSIANHIRGIQSSDIKEVNAVVAILGINYFGAIFIEHRKRICGIRSDEIKTVFAANGLEHYFSGIECQ